MKGRVLIVAGSDSGGGAGIQADIKTVTALDGYAATAITAITVQDTLGVHEILDIPPQTIAHQMRVVLEDIGADAIKIGMLHSAPIIETVAATLEEHANDVPVIVDPVIVSTTGVRLLEVDAATLLAGRLLPMASLLTPNIHEAEALTGIPVTCAEDFVDSALGLRAMGPDAVLVTGGDLEGDRVYDCLADRDGSKLYKQARIETTNTHGTGCTTASAIATGIAQGMTLRESVERARAYVLEAIRTAPDLGKGNGPVNHSHPLSGR